MARFRRLRQTSKVPKSTKNVTATVENALNTAREAVVTVENLPADFVAEYTVTSGSTVLSAYNFTSCKRKADLDGYARIRRIYPDDYGQERRLCTGFDLL